MNFREKLDTVTAAFKRLGNFYMIDPRTDIPFNAAPFHIEKERDLKIFAELASREVPWAVSKVSGRSVEGRGVGLKKLLEVMKQ